MEVDLRITGKIKVSETEIDPVNEKILKKFVFNLERGHPWHDIKSMRLGDDEIFCRVWDPAGKYKRGEHDGIHTFISFNGLDPPYNGRWGDVYLHVDRDAGTEGHVGEEIAYFEGSMFGTWPITMWFEPEEGDPKVLCTKPPRAHLSFYGEYDPERDKVIKFSYPRPGSLIEIEP